MTARTTSFIVNGADYFSAHLDNGMVRVGLRGCDCHDLPPGHKDHAAALAATTEADVEELHDALTGASLTSTPGVARGGHAWNAAIEAAQTKLLESGNGLLTEVIAGLDTGFRMRHA